jgi:hypothetical protein
MSREKAKIVENNQTQKDGPSNSWLTTTTTKKPTTIRATIQHLAIFKKKLFGPLLLFILCGSEWLSGNVSRVRTMLLILS